MSPEQRFEKLGLTLPPSPDPLGVYKLLLIDGNHALVSGHGTLKEDGTWIVGKVGQDLDAETGKLAAQQVGLAILATLKKYLGSLDRVDRVIKLLGMVNCVPDFTRHPYVINGCSELFANVWGDDKGVGVRSAVGVSSLPEGIPVEIEVLFKLN
ncbi:MAG TPA: RidA family protein [Cyclobacteriaceae bacterium]|nr:RidA family protein [Cyclobacteriaceae bacterium]HRK53366.1 RidA family protein [Cyclobacteriaceae bacterium]